MRGRHTSCSLTKRMASRSRQHGTESLGSGYLNAAEAKEATAAQIPAQIPSERSNMTIR